MAKICFFSGDITRGGGTERVSTMIANALAKEGKYKILFLSLVEQQEEPFFELNKDIRRYALGNKWMNPGLGYLKMIPRLRRFLKEHKIDIIIDIDIVLDVLSIPAIKGLNVKVISWEHFHYEYEMQSLYRRYILKYSLKRSDYMVTLTERDKKTYMEKTGRTERISAIYNPVQEISSYDIVQKEQWIITVGQLLWVKGIDYLAEVAGYVLKLYPNWKWLVVGAGEGEPFLREYIKDRKLENQLILTGRTDDVNSYLRKAQIFVMTSRSEGLPMCLLEAKAFSIPSISFDILTGPSEIIEDGVNGYLIPPFDSEDMAEKLIRLMQDEDLRINFAKHVWDNIEKFQMKNVLDNWNFVLNQMA